MSDKVKEILREIAFEPKGAWNNDPLKYTQNVVKWCMTKALEGLKILEAEG